MGFKVTKFGFFSRQMAVLAIVLLYVQGALASSSWMLQRQDQYMIQTPLYSGFGMPGAPYYYVSPPTNDSLYKNGLFELFPNSISYSRETHFLSPVLNADLSMGMSYFYTFNMSMLARNARMESQPIPQGVYQMIVAVVKADPNDQNQNPAASKMKTEPRFISPYQRLAAYTNTMFVPLTLNQITTKVLLTFPNPEDTALYTDLYIELVPMQMDCWDRHGSKYDCIQYDRDGNVDTKRSLLRPRTNYKPIMARIPFLPSQPKDGSPFTPGLAQGAPWKENGLGEFVTNALAYQARIYQQAQKRIGWMNPFQFAQERKLVFYRSEDPIFSRQIEQVWGKNNTPELLKRLDELLKIDIGHNLVLDEKFRPLVPVFCQMLFDSIDRNQTDVWKPQTSPTSLPNTYRARAGAAKRCQANPEQFVRMTRVTHVGKVNTTITPIWKVSRNSNFAVMTNFMRNRSSSKDAYASLTFKPHAPVFKLLESVTAYSPVDASFGASWSDSIGVAEGSISSLSSNLDFNVNMIEIPTANSTPCLQVSPLAIPGSPFFDTAPLAKNGLYICAPKQDQFSVTETYAQVVERPRQSNTSDPNSWLALTHNYSLRGEREASAFLFAIRNNIQDHNGNRVWPADMLNGAGELMSLRYFQSIAFSAPGTVIQPARFSGAPAPSLMGMLLSGNQKRFDSDRITSHPGISVD